MQTRKPGCGALDAVRVGVGRALRLACFFLSITGLGGLSTLVRAQQVTSQAPLSINGAQELPDSPPSAPFPDAEPIPVTGKGGAAVIQSDTQSKRGSLWVLDGHAQIDYKDRTLDADHVEYDSDTGDVTATGHLVVTGGDNDERIIASHGTLNMTTQTGRFYDVSGSVGVKPVGQRSVYVNGNPFLFTGRMVVKTGPQSYDVYEGTVTSCALPKPDWLLSASKFSVDMVEEKARATGSTFRLLSVPLLYLPYVTHSTNATARESGLLIPALGQSSSKGIVLGDQVYWVVNRSADVTAGAIFYSLRGWEENGTVRYRGRGMNFVRAHFTALQDRGYTPTGGTYTNQSGQDLVLSGRRDFLVDNGPEGPVTQTRMAGTVEYLSSFPYREAFSNNFNQAVSSDVVSTLYATREWNGYAASVEGDKYQGEKRVVTTLLPEQQVHIFHAPALEFVSNDRRLGATGLEWNLDSSATGLKRTQPNFVTSGIIERLDVHPELAYPFSLAGWRVRPSVAIRDTLYSRSRVDPALFPSGPQQVVPVESQKSLNRADVEVQVEARPQAIERTFNSNFTRKVFRNEVKHTVEPEATFRYVSGISTFQKTLRFDTVDVASNTNELEYGVTQRLFLRRGGPRPCQVEGAGADATEVLGPIAPDSDGAQVAGEPVEKICGNREWISWRLTQKYFFDPTFGGAISAGRRNILDTTLSFSGIAFLTEARNISPLVSRLRVRTTEKTDIEWDFDYDTGAKKFTADNIYINAHQGDVFAGITYARLNAPGRSYVEGVASAVSDFSQMRVRAGYGKPTKRGPSVAASVGLDINLGAVQYGAIETSYNWNCCGLSVEYQKYELGTARNENAYKFNFTLANIGTAGNIRRAEQPF